MIFDDKEDTEVYCSFDRRCHKIEDLKAMFKLINYEVMSHGSDEDGFQDHFFLEPISPPLNT